MNGYCKRLNSLPLRCVCGCGQVVKASTASFISYGRPPLYTRQCQGRIPERRKISSKTLKKMWRNPKFRQDYYDFWEKYWANPVRRVKRLKHTLSKELKERYSDPELVKWINDHAQELDTSPDIQSESFLSADRFFELSILFIEDHPTTEGDFEASTGSDLIKIGFYNFLGCRIETIGECDYDYELQL